MDPISESMYQYKKKLNKKIRDILNKVLVKQIKKSLNPVNLQTINSKTGQGERGGKKKLCLLENLAFQYESFS